MSEVGRNDPCPCGSGKKYKKCCINADRIKREAQKASREPHDLIGEHTSPWDMYKLLVSARENNMPKFVWAASHDQGPWRSKYDTSESYFRALGEGSDNMIARDGSRLLRIRHDHEDVLLLIERNGVAEIVTLRPNEFDAAGEKREVDHWGWRLWDVAHHDVPSSDDEVTFQALGYEWRSE